MSRNEGSRAAERPVVGVLGYGSLLAPEEIRDLVGDATERATPVRVDGFRRLFNQEASWRETEDAKRGVLNAVRSDGHRMNAVLLDDLTREEYAEFREREAGYRMVEVAPDALEPYRGDDEEHVAVNDILLVSTGTRVRDDIRPIPDYVDTCLEGASHWGEQFYEEFVRTTEIQPGEQLSGYLESHRLD